MKDISIIIPTYNRSEMLQRALLSIKTSNKENIEIIVCDDNSINFHREKNWEIIQEIQKNSSLEIYYIENTRTKGVSGARNSAIEHSSGEWLVFLDDDDEFSESYIDFIFEQIKGNNDIDLFWSNVIISRFQNNHEVKVKKYFTPQSIDELYKDIISIGLGYGVVIKKKAIVECGLFNENLKVAEDTDLFFKLISFGKTFKNLSCFGVILHEHEFEKLSKTYDYHAKTHVFKKLFRKYFHQIKKYNLLYISFSSWIVTVYKNAGMKINALCFCFEFYMRKINSKIILKQFMFELKNLR